MCRRWASEHPPEERRPEGGRGGGGVSTNWSTPIASAALGIALVSLAVAISTAPKEGQAQLVQPLQVAVVSPPPLQVAVVSPPPPAMTDSEIIEAMEGAEYLLVRKYSREYSVDLGFGRPGLVAGDSIRDAVMRWKRLKALIEKEKP